MTLFLTGLIIFCCGICYRIILTASKKKDENDEEITNESETKTTTGGID